MNDLSEYSPMNIAENFSRKAIESPNNIAIVSGELQTSYGELYISAIDLSLELRNFNVEVDGPIAILAAKNLELIQCVLGAAFSGRTFFILDESYPTEKLVAMCNVAKPTTLIHRPQSKTVATEIIAATSTIASSAAITYKTNSNPHRIQWSAHPTDNNQPAYLLFTSGTTGVPKCIQIGHEPLNHFVSWYVKEFKPTEESTFSLLSGIGHDPVLRDIFVPLAIGAAIHIPPKDFHLKPKRAFTWLFDSKVSYIHLTPQMVKVISSGADVGQLLPELNFAFFGGDTLTTRHISDLKRIAPNVQIVNFYGSSETPQAMGYHVVTSFDLDPIPIGTGIEGVDLRILRPDLSTANVFEKGQIAITTRFLAMGYLGDDALSNEKFIYLTNDHKPDKLTYLTGDMGYMRDDHRIVSNGRSDDQVKVRGFRIELNEINENILDIDFVDDSVTLAIADEDGENKLVTFLKLAKHAQHIDNFSSKLKTLLEQKLPAYAVPNTFIQVNSFPLLPNGKIDRQSLRELHKAQAQTVECNSEGTDIENLTAEFQKILGVSKIDPKLAFCELGADSLSYIRAAIVLEKYLGHEPADWENTPLENLVAQRKTKSGHLSQIGTTVLIRAVSIILVLMGHFEIINIPGSTTLLLFITGWSIGKYQLTPITKNKSPVLLLNTFAYIAIPTFIFNAFVTFKNSKVVDWSVIFLVNNFTSSPFLIDGYWYLNVLLQSLLIIITLLSIPFLVKKIEDDSFKFFSAAAVISIGIAIIDFYLQNSVPKLTPLQKIWVIFVGISFALAKSGKQRFIVFTLILTIGFDQYYRYGYSFMPVVLALFALIFSRVKVLSALVNPISNLAGGSLFIYLSHLQIKGLIDKTVFAGNKSIYLAAALIGGVAMWRVWDHIYEPIKRRIRIITDSRGGA